jgi:hypothetical protein
VVHVAAAVLLTSITMQLLQSKSNELDEEPKHVQMGRKDGAEAELAAKNPER